jgi:hypothetical protein
LSVLSSSEDEPEDDSPLENPGEMSLLSLILESAGRQERMLGVSERESIELLKDSREDLDSTSSF